MADGRGRHPLSTVTSDVSRFVVARLCAAMRAEDVTATLEPAPAAAGLDRVTVPHRPRALAPGRSSGDGSRARA